MPRRNSKGSDDERMSSTSRSQMSSAVRSGISGITPGDHELSVLGVGNVTRRFDLDEPTNGPSIVVRWVAPCAGITLGWSADSDPSGSVQDWTSAVDVTVAKPSEVPLYPITPYAAAFADDVWPVLQNLFSSGTGQRSLVSLGEFVRYQSMMAEAYQSLLYPLMLNHLCYHMDWTKVFPYTGIVPSWLYDYTTSMNANDVGIASFWLPLLKRMDTKVLFPRLVNDIKRCFRICQSVDLNGRIRMAIPATIDMNMGYQQVGPRVRELLDYVEGNVDMARISATINTFLPFPMALADPWNFGADPVLDVHLETAAYNSGCHMQDIFGDTGDPTWKDTLMLTTLGGSWDGSDPLTSKLTTKPAIFYSGTPQPTWAELRLASFYELVEFELLDDVFRLISLHGWGNIALVDDAFDIVSWQGQAVNPSGVAYRYSDYTNCRFSYGDIDYGTMKPGLTGVEILCGPLLRMARVDVHWMFHLATLKGISIQLTGASLRELRSSISGLVLGDISRGS